MDLVRTQKIQANPTKPAKIHFRPGLTRRGGQVDFLFAHLNK
jgi:hypothetical protein